jgi:hypothetical protein
MFWYWLALADPKILDMNSFKRFWYILYFILMAVLTLMILIPFAILDSFRR